MATWHDWIEGARLRTLPAAVAPVLAGTAVAAFEAHWEPGFALLCLLVSLSLQVGVNYANDYSDGIRGTDANRVGPARLVGGGLASPQAVKWAAFACFGVAVLAGATLVLCTQMWWLIMVGILCILAAWYYTGGDHPYGYAGFGELFVFIFFGLVAVCGTTLVQLGWLTAATLWMAVCVGLWAVAILLANNLRDIDGDRTSGKRTLPTRIGDSRTRKLWVATVAAALASLLIACFYTTWWGLLGLISMPVVWPAIMIVIRKGKDKALIHVLKITGIGELVCAVGYALGVVIAGF